MLVNQSKNSLLLFWLLLCLFVGFSDWVSGCFGGFWGLLVCRFWIGFLVVVVVSSVFVVDEFWKLVCSIGGGRVVYHYTYYGLIGLFCVGGISR